MNNPEICYTCQDNFDVINKVPIVLKCGDSACMSCLLYKSIDRL